MKSPGSSQRVSPGHTPPSSPSEATAAPDESSGPATDERATDERAPVESGPSARELRGVLVGLIVPFAVIVLNMLMFGVAVPAIRDQFGMEADTVALLVTAYTLPFVLFMPMYGQLGDSLGKRRLFSIGIVVFFAGTVICLFSTTLGSLFLGRVLQGMGTAGINPLCIAIITDLFPPTERGRALGTWSSTGPAASIVAPLLSGFLIDSWGWHSIFVPIILGSAVSLYVVHVRLPSTTPPKQPGLLRNFDWLGLLLLSGVIITFVFYLTSRPITGIEPLRDWRLLLLMPALFAGLLWRERRAFRPLVPLHLFRYAGFGRASVVAGVRMFLMSGFGLLLPLYLVDIHGFSAARVGLYSTSLSVALLVTTPLGGRLADRWDRRMPVATGLMMQAIAISAMALVPASAPVLIPLALVLDGLGAGLSLAVLPRIAMDQVPKHESGVAAGLYSMNRYFGSILGATLVGVFLQQALLRQTTIAAYQASFWFSAAFAILGIVVIWRVKG